MQRGKEYGAEREQIWEDIIEISRRGTPNLICESIGKQIRVMWEREIYWPEGSEEACMCVYILYVVENTV